MAAMTDETFRLELLKLLLQVTWADDVAEEAEVRALLDRARAWGVPEPEIAILEERIRAHEPLPAPNLGLLKSRRDEVLAEARALAATDGALASGSPGLFELEGMSEIQRAFAERRRQAAR